MERKAKLQLIVWIKRVLGMTAIGLWMVVFYTIVRSAAPFIEQAPYCMASTMLIFGLLTAAYKGLDHWILEQKDD